jgi:hypothetical protein
MHDINKIPHFCPLPLWMMTQATGWRTAHNPVNTEILDFTDR